MPDGLVQWFDPDAGEGRVLHRRRRYAVRAADIESAARVPGARVHFDIDHESGGTHVTDVTLRRGTRSMKRQSRYGDLKGASTHETKKPPTTGHEEFDLDPEIFRNPMRAAEYWAEQMAIGDLDEVMVLYSPTASLHDGREVHVGFDAIRRHWQPSSRLGGPGPSSISGGADGAIVVRWPSPDGDDGAVESRLEILHGEITQQWEGAVAGAEPPAEETPPIELPVELSVEGDVSQRHRDRAVDRIGKVLSRIDAPVLHARIRLVNAVEPRDRPAVARVMLDVNGQPVRASVATDDLDGAIDALEQRLRQQVDR
ncbi:MAG TPA: HPF/RaiA family ribosome-associated protein, partial [Euzebya sp.]|nr:HPF/RaiA family ribosome-associated protein [Euzebya sp.]